jgi:uncharacterized repeat protein (TIGR01451 family)
MKSSRFSRVVVYAVMLAALGFMTAGDARAQLAQNGTSTLSTFWNAGTLTRNVAHTTPLLENRLIIVAVQYNINNSTGTTVASVTYGLQPLVLGNAITDGGTDIRTELWLRLAPLTGSNNVAVTMQNVTGTVDGVIGVSTYVDVDPALTGSLGYTFTNTGAGPTNGGLAGTAAGDMVVDFTTGRMNTGGTLTASLGPGQTLIHNANSPAALDTDDVVAVGSYEFSTGVAVTMSYTLSASRPWAMVGGSLRGARTDVAITGMATPDLVDAIPTNVTFSYEITAHSAGANNVQFADTLPAGLTFVSVTPSQGTCTGGASTNCSLGSIAAGVTATVTLVASTPAGAAGTTYNNVGSVSSGTIDPVAANNSVTTPVRTQGRLCATPGKDGAGGTLTGAVNSYFPGTANAAAGATAITVGAVPGGYGTTGITAGDLLLVMQMQDAALDSTNDERYGDGTGTGANTGSPGNGASNLNNAGRYEYVVATNTVTTAGGTINITGAGGTNGLIYAYTNAAATGTQGARRFQVIRVPQHTTATISPAIVTPAWNGAVGGVFAVDSSGTVTMGSNAGTGTVATTAGSLVVSGTGTAFLSQLHSGDTINITGETARTIQQVVTNTQIILATAAATTGTGRAFTVPHLSASGIGFRGGAGRQLAGGAGADTDYRTLATNTANGQKGEGIAGTPRYLWQNSATPLDTAVEGYPNGSSARGGPGNAGGGGTDGNIAANDENAGGGGGANGGTGGSGGNAWNSADASGGFGGLFDVPSTTRIILGGGGAAGSTNNGTAVVPAGTPAMGAGIASSGAPGGGIVIIRANQISGTGTIAANGANARHVLNDAGGGGGAGGTIIITTQFGNLSSVTVTANGGRGGDAWPAQAAGAYPGERHGPGGGGGGGAVYLSSAAASVSVAGGTNGITTDASDNFGAGPGLPGVQSTPLGAMAGAEANYGCAIADLAVTNVDTPDPVTPGANINYTQVVTNNGPNAADQVVFTSAIPASASFVSVSVPAGWTCTTPAVGATTGQVRCTIPSLASAATASFTVVMQSSPGTAVGYVISDTAQVSSNTPDSNAANDTATTTTNVTAAGYADMRVTISDSPDPVVANNDITYTQTISNGGVAAAATATYTISTPPNTNFRSITPPAGWSCLTPIVGGAGAITCTNPSMPAGTTVNMPLVLRVNAGTAAGTIITATPTVSSSTPDPYTFNNAATTTTTVVAVGTADLATTTVGSPDPAYPTSNISFTQTVTNNGPVAATNASFTQNTPAGTTFQSMTVPAGWACVTPAVGATGAITCTRANVPVGTSSTFIPVFRVNAGTAAGTTITDSVNVTATTTDGIPANNPSSDSIIVAARTSADVAIVKTDSPDPVGEGQMITYTLRVTNNGPAVATNVTVADNLPGTVSFIRSTPSAGTCSGTTNISCNLGSLAVGNTATVVIVVQALSTGTVNNTATVTATETDPVPANNSSTASTTVLAVTLVHLRDLHAYQKNKKVSLVWETSFESDNLGFNLYRDLGGERTKLNKDIIAGSALQSKKHDSTAGRVYRFTDKLDSANVFAQYWLEDVDLSGVKTMHGPVSTVPDDLAEALPNTTPLPGLGDGASVLESPAGYGFVRNLALPKAGSKELEQQYELAAETGLKIYVSREGLYRVTRAAMATAGYDPGSDTKALALYSSGVEQPMLIADGGDGKLDPNDAIEFYGVGLDTISTGARTYWLRNGKGNADRIKLSKSKGGDPVTGSVPFTYEKKERGVFFAALVTNGEEQNFFGPVVGSWSATQSLTVGAIDPSYGGNATVEIAVQGGTLGAHVTRIELNGQTLGIANLIDQQAATFTYTFPHSLLTAGTNTLRFTALNGDEDISVIGSTRLTYRHLLQATNGALQVSLPGGRSATVGGFTAGKVRAFDVTDATQPAELETEVAPQGAGFAATFTPGGSGARTVLVFHESRVAAAPELSANRPSSWSATKQGFDFAIVTNTSFASQAATLKPVRVAEGLSTEVVDVEDLYDEFNFGIRDPQAIRSFFQSALTWKTAPRYALLVGDASSDPRDYYGFGSVDYVPTKMVVTTQIKTASDDWLTDFDNDGIANIAIGRLPVRTASEATTVLNKIISRGTPSGTWASNVLFVADRPGDYDFAGVTATLQALLPASMSSQTIEFALVPSPTAAVTSAMNAGQLVVDFVGHGSAELWSTNAFHSSTAFGLTNGSRLPVVISMTCLNGYFHDIFTESLGEALLKAPNGGAIAVWASSTLTQPDQQAIMNRELFRQIFGSTSITLGDAVRRAKTAAIDPDVRKSWILLGDPSMKVR